jgi:hypothetical protein
MLIERFKDPTREREALSIDSERPAVVLRVLSP